MGEVWSAHDDVLNRTVAIKIIRSHLADDESIRARLQVEARLAGSLSHPGIVDVFDYGEDEIDGRTVPYLVMPYVEGSPLSQILRERGVLTLGETMAIVAEVADALETAHVAGIVHRDLKPANILLTSTGRVMLVDFGIARSVGGESLTQTGALIGTADYLSPEQSSGRSATHISDLYALGVVAYACLTGSPPFHRDSDIATALAHIQEPLPDLPPEVVEAGAGPLLEGLLSKDPADRPQSAAEVAVAARRFATAAPLPVDPGGETAGTQVVNASPLLQETQPGTSGIAPTDTVPGIVPGTAETVPVAASTVPGTAETVPVTASTVPVAASTSVFDAAPAIAADGTSEIAASHAGERRGRRRVVMLSSAIVLLAIVAVFLLLNGGKQITVPDVRGMTTADATAKLKADGLKITTTTADVAHHKAGEVAAQSPSPGDQVDKGSVVKLTVATGRIAIPRSLIGMTYEDAAAALTKLGLRATRVDVASTKSAGTVISVSPTTTALPGTTITLAVALGSDDNGKSGTSDKGNGKGNDKSKPKKPKGSTTPSPGPTTTTSPAPTDTATSAGP
ncbi:MAG: serine/threonine protein kinase [Aeromicrobium sp.]|nr:serine/threonine protein kinase [Aeromicrobium sp.]